MLPGSIKPVETRLVPKEHKDVLLSAEQFFLEQGFKIQTYVKREPLLNGHDWGLFGVLLYHDASNSWALGFIEPKVHQVLPWKCIFLTPNQMRGIATVNCDEHKIDLSEQGYDVEDSMVISVSEQWDHHQERLKENVDALFLESNLISILEAFEMIYFQGLVETGSITPRKNGYHYTFKESFKVNKRTSIIRKTLNSKIYQLENDKSEKPKNILDDKREFEAYKAYVKVKDSNQSTWIWKTIFLLLSVLLFGFSFGLTFSWTTILLFIVVLFIHEAGHLFGMWIFGYKDLKVLFVPFLGAFASGKKKNVNIWQEAIVLLLGPLPGYVLGIALLFNGIDELPNWMFEFVIISIILNLFNLLPIMPLDGGKIINIVFFSRLPYLQFFFMLLSVLSFLYIGVFLNEKFTLLIGLVLLITLPSSFRENKLLKFLLKEKLHKRPFEIGQLIKSLRAHSSWETIQYKDKWSLIDLLSFRLQHANHGILTRAVILVLWIATIIMPLYVFVPADVWSDLHSLITLSLQKILVGID